MRWPAPTPAGLLTSSPTSCSWRMATATRSRASASPAPDASASRQHVASGRSPPHPGMRRPSEQDVGWLGARYDGRGQPARLLGDDGVPCLARCPAGSQLGRQRRGERRDVERARSCPRRGGRPPAPATRHARQGTASGGRGDPQPGGRSCQERRDDHRPHGSAPPSAKRPLQLAAPTSGMRRPSSEAVKAGTTVTSSPDRSTRASVVSLRRPSGVPLEVHHDVDRHRDEAGARRTGRVHPARPAPRGGRRRRPRSWRARCCTPRRDRCSGR